MTMNNDIRYFTLAIFAVLLPIAVFHRLRSARTGESLDRTKEGWHLLLPIRLAGLAGFGQLFALLYDPDHTLLWALIPGLSPTLRWTGVALTAAAAAWLIWMFVSLGSNITDTVVTRKNAYFVDWGPYRFVRNPMYTGLLLLGVGLGLAFARWSLTAAMTVIFALLAIRTRREETYLIARFGDQYRDYMNRVGRFFPVLR
jgi:protein-S-isoprenylcysteine O-methyltransferase Ste14